MTDLQPVGFEVQPLPLFLRAPNALADSLGIVAPRLTPENLLKAGARKAGLPANFPSHVEEALEVLCRSFADDSKLHWFGRMNQWNIIVTGLSALLKVEEAFRADPTLADQPLLDPLIVTGLPRSGTTFLHRLLSAAPEARGIALYEHIHPADLGWPNLRALDAKVMFEPWKHASGVHGLDAIHFVRPDLPDECTFGMRLGGRSIIYWATAPTYSYLRWLLEQDQRESYVLYRKVLQLHQRRHPGKRITLKCPHHLAWLPSLVAAIPEAKIVQTHRDPLQAVPSESKLILALQGLSTHELDWKQSVEHNHLKVRTYALRSADYAATPEGSRVLHVDYKQLVKDPVNIAEQIHRHHGLPFDESHREALGGFFNENRQHKHGRNHYTLEQFGFTESGLREAFAPYQERFLDGERAAVSVSS